MNRVLAIFLASGFVLMGVLGFAGVPEECAATISRGFTCQNFSFSILLALLLAVGFLATKILNPSFTVGDFFKRHAFYPVKRELTSWLSLHEASPAAF